MICLKELLSASSCKWFEATLLACRGSSAAVPSPGSGGLVVPSISCSRAGGHSAWTGSLANHHGLAGGLQQPLREHRVCHQQCHCQDLSSHAQSKPCNASALICCLFGREASACCNLPNVLHDSAAHHLTLYSHRRYWRGTFFCTHPEP